MEVAGYLIKTASSVTVIVRGKAPFESVFGMKIGALLQRVTYTHI